MIAIENLDHIDTGPARDARTRCRGGSVEPTSRIAPGFTQTNMIVPPRDWAFHSLLYAQRDPKACPVLNVSDPGSYATLLTPSADLRTGLPLYHTWRDGKLAEETADATAAWARHPDLVSFLIGCRLTFETTMDEAGIEIRHITDKSSVPMYLTDRACRPADRLHGNVVPMRPIKANRVADAATTSGRCQAGHRALVHIGSPEEIGIKDLERPELGNPVRIETGEIPVLWACGATPQAAVMASGVRFAITHTPAHMSITDVPDVAYHA